MAYAPEFHNRMKEQNLQHLVDIRRFNDFYAGALHRTCKEGHNDSGRQLGHYQCKHSRMGQTTDILTTTSINVSNMP
eukprot:2299745-Amphidinium_carterae.1